MNILREGTFSYDVNQYISTNIITELAFYAGAEQASFENAVMGVGWGKLQDRIEWSLNPYLAELRRYLTERSGDLALQRLLSQSFLTVVSRSRWELTTGKAQRFDLELLERHEIFFRVRPLDDDHFFLIPDDRLEEPSLMLQVLAVPWRVGVLKLGFAGDGLRWSAAVTGSCDGVTGDCVPGPPGGCCEWHEGQDGAGEGWVCCC